MSSFIHITNPLIYDSEIDFSSIKNVLLIDSQIKNHSEIVASVNEDTFSIIYSTNSERNDLIALLQDKFISIQRLGICFELEPEKIFLNLESFFVKNEKGPYSKNVQFLMELMEEFSVSHLDFLCSSDLDIFDTQEWKDYFYILKKEGEVGFENHCYFISGFDFRTFLQPCFRWLQGFSAPCSMAIYENQLFIANFASSCVSKVMLSDSSDTLGREWKRFEEPLGLAVHGKYLYVSNYSEENGYISRINLQTMEVQEHWFDDLVGPAGIAISENDDLYICDYLDNKIIRVNIYHPHDFCIWITLESPVTPVIYGGFMYVSCLRDGCIYKICLTTGKFVDQLDIENPISMAVSRNGLMYISCLYSVSENLVYVLDLSSGEFVESLDISYNGVGSLLVYEGELYMANYLSTTVMKFPVSDFVPIVEMSEDEKKKEKEEFQQTKEEYFREEMLVLEEQRREQEEKHREDLLALEIRLLERLKEEEKQREELRLMDSRLLEEEKHREELRVKELRLLEEEIRLKEEEKHREELRVKELRLLEEEIRAKEELRLKELEIQTKELELQAKELEQHLKEELRLKELEIQTKELEIQAKESEQRLKEELRAKELEFQGKKENSKKEIKKKDENARLKEEIKNIIQNELSKSQTQSEIDKNEDWKNEIRNIIKSVIQNEILDIIKTPIEKVVNDFSSQPVLKNVITPDADTDNIKPMENMKPKFQKHFSSIGGFSYSGKPIEQKLSIFDKQIQKMGMKHY